MTRSGWLTLAMAIFILSLPLGSQTKPTDSTPKTDEKAGTDEKDSGKEAPKDTADKSGEASGEKTDPAQVDAGKTDSAVKKVDSIDPADQSKPDYASVPLGPDGKPRALTMEETVKMVLKHNTDLRMQQLELTKSDTEIKKDESKYAPIVGLTYQGLKKRDKPVGSTVISGTKTTSDTIAANVSKLFETGTYFQVEVSKNRLDTNAGEDASARGTFLALLAAPALHTGALKIILRQELVKNSFGYVQRRANRIARNNTAILRENLVYSLSQLIVVTMVDYWQLAIAEENVNTAETLLENTRNILAITYRKRRLGLAEGFEISQWQALVAQAEAQLQNASLARDNARRTILRALNLPPTMELSGATKLMETRPEDLDVEADIAHALKTRPDFRNIRLQMDNARMAMEIAKNSRLPSVSVGGSFTHRDVSETPGASFRNVPSGKYPEYAVEFKVEYPLWDEGSKVDVRNAKVSLRQLALRERDLRRKVEDEVRQGASAVKATFEIFEKTKEAEEQTRAFYNGLVLRYRQGRFTAVAVKNALDALAQSRQALIQAKINYNISLVRYELARNSLLRKFNVDADKYVNPDEK